MIVGIGGVSRAGKGTLSRLLKEKLQGYNISSAILPQDQHIQKDIPKIGDRLDWEVPESLDFNAYYKAAKELAPLHDVLFCEGLLAFYDQKLLKLYDKKIFIKISKTTFYKRKQTDFRWGKEVEPHWYMDHIWDSYLIFGIPPLDESFLVLSGDKKFDLDRVVDFLFPKGAGSLLV